LKLYIPNRPLVLAQYAHFLCEVTRNKILRIVRSDFSPFFAMLFIKHGARCNRISIVLHSRKRSENGH